MARLLSVNVGMPTDVQWRGKNVHTGIWKSPVSGPVMVRRLNLDGDGQGDLTGHGGEQRAVLVYQSESYDHWRAFLHRDDLEWGGFGENFTVTGLADGDVCIGDRYRIGEAEFEVTQPRVTCFRVGMRLNQPDLPGLLVAHGRPGFYLRVITEGRVRSGDEIVPTARGRHELSVADVDALLYLPGADADRLRAAVDIPALSPGWRQSFADILAGRDRPEGAGWTGFRMMRVTEIRHESADVLSIYLESADSTELPKPLPGQYLTIRVDGADDPAPLRSYSLSNDPSADRYRISVKRAEDGWASRWLHANTRTGSMLPVAAPRGEFSLSGSETPVVLLSAGVGVTPVLAMLHAVRTASPNRRVVWIYTTRSRGSHPFAREINGLIEVMPNATEHVFYSGEGNRLDRDKLEMLGLPSDADVYLCGPGTFMDAMRAGLLSLGFVPDRIHTEVFGALPAIRPGIVDTGPAMRPHPPPGPAGAGPAVTFSRSGITARWSPEHRSLLEFAEACDIAVRYSCRSGVCHTCVTDVVSGTATYTEEPLQRPAPGTTLVCCAIPEDDLVLNL